MKSGMSIVKVCGKLGVLSKRCIMLDVVQVQKKKDMFKL